MNVEYKRDLNHVYLILKGSRPDPETYQVRMLIGNAVPMLLQCRIVNVDDEYLLYFDITSKQKLSAVYAERKLSCDDLFLILSETVSAMETMEEYLLKPGQLILDPEYMYLDADGRKLFFIMLPGESKDPGTKFRIMMESLLPRIDHDRKDAVSLGYGVYRIAAGNFSLEEIKKILYRGGGQKSEERTRLEKSYRAEIYENQMPETDYSSIERPDKKEFVQKGAEVFDDKKKGSDFFHSKFFLPAACVLAAAGILALSAASMYGLIPGISADMMLGALIVCLAAGLMIYRILEKRKALAKHSTKEKQKGEEQQLYRQLRNEPDAVTERTEISLYRGNEEKEDPGNTIFVRSNPDDSTWILKSILREIPDIRLEKEITLIGKMKQTCDTVLKEETVSRIHARIRKEGEDYRLMDMNSRNGTFVNGRPLETGEEYCLKAGDKVAFGRAEFEFCQTDPENVYPYEI